MRRLSIFSLALWSLLAMPAQAWADDGAADIHDPITTFYYETFAVAPEEERLLRLGELTAMMDVETDRLNAKSGDMDTAVYVSIYWRNHLVMLRAFKDMAYWDTALSMLDELRPVLAGTYLEIEWLKERAELYRDRTGNNDGAPIILNYQEALAHPEFLQHPDPTIRAGHVEMIRTLAYALYRGKVPSLSCEVFERFFLEGASGFLFQHDGFERDWAFYQDLIAHGVCAPGARGLETMVSAASAHFDGAANLGPVILSPEELDSQVRAYESHASAVLEANMWAMRGD
jgi:hypothetical protein